MPLAPFNYGIGADWPGADPHGAERAGCRRIRLGVRMRETGGIRERKGSGAGQRRGRAGECGPGLDCGPSRKNRSPTQAQGARIAIPAPDLGMAQRETSCWEGDEAPGHDGGQGAPAFLQRGHARGGQARAGYLDRRGGNHGPQLLLGDPRDRGEGPLEREVMPAQRFRPRL